jgi:hypothetical protein
MWKCLNCSEQIEEELDVCWNCQTVKDGSSAETYFSPRVVPKELADIEERMSKQSDSDLLRLIMVDFKDYRQDAIDLARAELERRGVPQPPPPIKTPYSRAKKSADKEIAMHNASPGFAPPRKSLSIKRIASIAFLVFAVFLALLAWAISTMTRVEGPLNDPLLNVLVRTTLAHIAMGGGILSALISIVIAIFDLTDKT